MAGSVRPNGYNPNSNISRELYNMDDKTIDHKTQMMVRTQRELINNLMITFRKYDTLVNKAMSMKAPFKKQEIANIKSKIDSLRTQIQFQIVGVRNLSNDILTCSNTSIERNSPLPGETQTNAQKSYVDSAVQSKKSALNGFYLTKKIGNLTRNPNTGMPEPPTTLEQFVFFMKKSLVYDNFRPTYEGIVDEKDRAIAQDLFYHPENTKHANILLNKPSRVLKRSLKSLSESIYNASYVGKHTKLHAYAKKVAEGAKKIAEESKKTIKSKKLSLESLREFVRNYSRNINKNDKDK